MANLITRPQAAKLLNVTPQAIARALKAGRITYADPEKRLFDEAALLGQWQGNRRRQRTPKAVAGPATGHADDLPALQKRRLHAEVKILEQKANNAGSVDLPSVQVERGMLYGLQLMRASLAGADGVFFDDVERCFGEKVAQELYVFMQEWWGGVYNCACDSILMGFQRECGRWGRDFHARWVARERGNFPDVPYPGEPRSIDALGKGNGEAHEE